MRRAWNARWAHGKLHSINKQTYYEGGTVQGHVESQIMARIVCPDRHLRIRSRLLAICDEKLLHGVRLRVSKLLMPCRAPIRSSPRMTGYDFLAWLATIVMPPVLCFLELTATDSNVKRRRFGHIFQQPGIRRYASRSGSKSFQASSPV